MAPALVTPLLPNILKLVLPQHHQPLRGSTWVISISVYHEQLGNITVLHVHVAGITLPLDN